ncbi:VOC family protein [Burkholderia plantarii]|uniref:VOC family protein n=1 Tax=Burkholderia plantarii TaxID=41899 RepID=UPI002729BF67|nr:VOC family protein [Burkholderia plantarii]WLE62310.1 VOC family protein [Burkholderia plantarii]
MSEIALTRGIDHLGLTVRDLSETRAFFETCLGWKLLGERPEYPAAFVSDGHVTLTLWQVKDPEVVEFDRKRNIGLHHLALRVASEAALNTLYERVAAWPGVRVEFAPEPLGKGTKRHTMIYEPGGIRLEFDYDTAAKAG